MKKITLTAIFIATVISFVGCAPANTYAEIRESSLNNTNYNMETRCVQVDMRNNKEMDGALKQFDGWRVFYISEYTTAHRIGTDGAVCFEREKK